MSDDSPELEFMMQEHERRLAEANIAGLLPEERREISAAYAVAQAKTREALRELWAAQEMMP